MIKLVRRSIIPHLIFSHLLRFIFRFLHLFFFTCNQKTNCKRRKKNFLRSPSFTNTRHKEGRVSTTNDIMQDVGRGAQDELEEHAISWSDYEDMVIKTGIQVFATNNRIPYDLIPFPERKNFVPFAAMRDIINEGFQQEPSDGVNGTIYISRDGSLILKELKLDNRREWRNTIRNKLLELRNLLLLKKEVEFFTDARGFMNKIMRSEKPDLQDLINLRQVFNNTITLHQVMEVVETQPPRDKWCFEYLKRLLDFVINNPAALDIPDRVRSFKEQVQKLLNGHYSLPPRIIFADYFSIQKEVVPGQEDLWHIYIVTRMIRVPGILPNLEKFLIHEYPNRIPETVALAVIRDVASLVAFLHGIHYIHGDIKLDNFFIERDPDNPERYLIYLGDLGLSRMGDFTVSTGGFPPIMPPEFMQGRRRPSDVFAFGMTIMQVVARGIMKDWFHLDNDLVKKYISEGTRPYIPDYVHRGLVDVINGCLEETLEEIPDGLPRRRTIHEVLEALNQIQPRDGVLYDTLNQFDFRLSQHGHAVQPKKPEYMEEFS